MKTTWQRAEFLFTLLVVVVTALALWSSTSFSQRAGLFPWVILPPTLALALWQLVDDFRGKTSPPRRVAGDMGDTAELDAGSLTGAQRRRELGVVAWILGFLVAIGLLGFAIGGGLASAVMLRVRSGERPVVCGAYAIATYLVLDILFRQGLSLPLPPGALFEWLDVNPQVNWRGLLR